MGSCMGMMLLDIFLYAILAWYFDLVLPQEYGTPERPLFFLERKYWSWLPCWIPFRRIVVLTGEPVDDYMEHIPELKADDEEAGAASSGGAEGNVEIVNAQLRPSAKVLVSGLRKRYNDGKLAVKSISFAIFPS